MALLCTRAHIYTYFSFWQISVLLFLCKALCLQEVKSHFTWKWKQVSKNNFIHCGWSGQIHREWPILCVYERENKVGNAWRKSIFLPYIFINTKIHLEKGEKNLFLQCASPGPEATVTTELSCAQYIPTPAVITDGCFPSLWIFTTQHPGEAVIFVIILFWMETAAEQKKGTNLNE